MLCIDKQNLILASSSIQHRRVSVSTSQERWKLQGRSENGFCSRFYCKANETKNAETICLELTINKKKWWILFAYHLQILIKKNFLIKFQLASIGKCDNIILAGDLKIDELRPCSDSSKNQIAE